jgi:phosphoribosylformylglycinamidine synthase subunit PurS
MEHVVEVRVSLKKGALDAEGETVQKSLALLGYPVKKVDTVKVYRLFVEAASNREARELAEAASRRLLANPVIQDFTITVV